jgi:glutathione S-transferase
MITVYGFVPFDRSGRVRWMLHELGLEFEDQRLKFGDKGNRSPEFLAMSPLGRVPTMTCDDVTLFESSVILTWLGRKFGKGSLDPASHDPSQYDCWMALASASMDPICFEFVRPDVPDDDKPMRRAQASRDMNRSISGALNSQLAERDSILTGGFCAVDIQVAANLHYADRVDQLAEQPRLRSWLDQMRGRPAAQASNLFGNKKS